MMVVVNSVDGDENYDNYDGDGGDNGYDGDENYDGDDGDDGCRKSDAVSLRLPVHQLHQAQDKLPHLGGREPGWMESGCGWSRRFWTDCNISPGKTT